MLSKHPQLNDPCYGDLALLLTAEGPIRLLRASGLSVEAVRRTYIRLKPGSGALLGLTLTTMDRSGALVELPAYVRCHERERAAQIAAKWHSGRSVATALGDGVRLLAGGKSVLFLFPNDARVRGMRFVADVDKLKRILGELPALQGLRVRASKTRLQVQRYKPERRLIIRAELGLKDDSRGLRSERSMFLRFFVDDRGRELAQLIGTLRTQEVGPHIPKPLGCLQGGRMYVEQAVDGAEGLAHVVAGRADPAALALALTRLHRADVPGARSLDNAEVLARAVEAGASLALLAPELKTDIDLLLDAMRAQVPAEGPLAFLHGDLHLHQVLWTDRGPVLVDFERSARGHPLYDLGQALAHLQAQNREQCADFAARLLPEFLSMRADLDLGELPFFVAHGLLQRALLPARRLTQGWSSRCRDLIDQAREQIAVKHIPRARSRFFELTLAEDEIAWDRFYPNSGARWPGRITASDGTLQYGNFDHDLRRFKATNPPQDRQLPGLASALTRGSLVAYRPGRRATVKCRGDGDVRYIKLIRPNRITKVLSHHLAAKAVGAATGSPFPIFPALVEVAPASGALGFCEVKGPSLHSILSRPDPGADASIDAVAESLAALHLAPIPNDYLPLSPIGRSLEEWVNLLRRHDPELANDCQAVLARIDDLPPACRRENFVHGDLHDRNILFSQGGVVFLDLDDFGRGDSLQEIGNLLAQFILRKLQAGEPADAAEVRIERFLRCYRSHGGVALNQQMDRAMACTLVRLACLYRFRRSQAQVCRPLLAEAHRRTQVGCRA